MATRVGTSSFGITVIINDRLFDVNAVLDLDMTFGLDMFPHGSFTVNVIDDPDFKVESGMYGRFVYLNTNKDGMDGKGFSFLIRESHLSVVNEHVTKLFVAWELGNSVVLNNRTIAFKGSSLDALVDIFKSYEDNVAYENKLLGDSAKLTDNMTWRLILSNMQEELTEVVTHSVMEGDMMFWAYDDTSNKFIISSLNTGISTGNPQACFYSQSSLEPTSSSTFIDPNTGSQVWKYSLSNRINDRGTNLESMFPSMVFTTVEKGNAVVSQCNGACYGGIVVKYGAMPAEDAKDQYEINEDVNPYYGETNFIEEFTGNTHKSYVLAPFIRNRILSEYGKKFSIDLVNTLGPAIGSRVYVRALKPTYTNGSDIDEDQYYTDTYIVGARQIIKRESEKGGILNADNDDFNPDYITRLMLISKSVDTENYANTKKNLTAIAQNCAESMNKEK